MRRRLPDPSGRPLAGLALWTSRIAAALLMGGAVLGAFWVLMK